jgi:hypothetical protein
MTETKKRTFSSKLYYHYPNIQKVAHIALYALAIAIGVKLLAY